MQNEEIAEATAETKISALQTIENAHNESLDGGEILEAYGRLANEIAQYQKDKHVTIRIPKLKVNPLGAQTAKAICYEIMAKGKDCIIAFEESVYKVLSVDISYSVVEEIFMLDFLVEFYNEDNELMNCYHSFTLSEETVITINGNMIRVYDEPIQKKEKKSKKKKEEDEDGINNRPFDKNEDEDEYEDDDSDEDENAFDSY